MELKIYLTTLARRWKIVLGVTLLIFLLSIFYAIRFVSYEADTSLQIITPLVGSMDYTYYDTTFADRLINTTAQIATSDQLKQELKNKLNLDVVPDISVKIIPDSEIIQIVVDSRDPVLAARAANALADLIISDQNNTVANTGISNEIDILDKSKADLIAALTQDQAKYDTIVQSYSQNAAQLSILDGTIQVSRTSYQNLLDQYQRALLAGDKAQSDFLGKEMNTAKTELDSLNQQYQDLLSQSNVNSEDILLARQTIQNDQTAYTNLLSQYNTVLSAQSRSGRAQSIQIVSPAVEPTKPTLSRFFILTLGLVFGLIVGIVVAFIYNDLSINLIHQETKKRKIDKIITPG